MMRYIVAYMIATVLLATPIQGKAAGPQIEEVTGDTLILFEMRIPPVVIGMCSDQTNRLPDCDTVRARLRRLASYCDRNVTLGLIDEDADPLMRTVYTGLPRRDLVFFSVRTQRLGIPMVYQRPGMPKEPGFRVHVCGEAPRPDPS